MERGSNTERVALAGDLGLRPAANADGESVRSLVFGVLEEYGLVGDPAETDADLTDLEASYHDREGRFDVLETPDGRIVGCVGLYPVDETTVELRKMYLLPEVRGRGVGRALLDHALARARESGYERMVLETASVLQEAIALYRKHGFEPIAGGHCSSRCDQMMALQL